VRAEKLSPAAIVGALRRGDFYASNGVALEDYEATTAKKEIVIKMKCVNGKQAWTQPLLLK
jgi:hypothetical protein